MPVRITRARASIPMCQRSRTISAVMIGRRERAKALPPFLVIREHVVAGAGWGEQYRITGPSRRARGSHRRIKIVVMNLQLHHRREVPLDQGRCLAVCDYFFHFPSDSVCERRIAFALVTSTEKKDGWTLHSVNRHRRRADVGSLRIVDPLHARKLTDELETVRQRAKAAQGCDNARAGFTCPVRFVGGSDGQRRG